MYLRVQQHLLIAKSIYAIETEVELSSYLQIVQFDR